MDCPLKEKVGAEKVLIGIVEDRPRADPDQVHRLLVPLTALIFKEETPS